MPTPDPATTPTRHRTPADWVWLAFLLWTSIGFAVLPFDLGERQVRVWIHHAPIRDAAIAFLHASDAIWMLLAATNVYLHTAAAEGLPTARRWALIILVASACFETLGVRTGFPFGRYRYTDHFGWRIGGLLPAAIPLAWLVILLCGRYLMLAIRPQAARWELALGVAAVAVLTDLNLERVAWKVRGYWIWRPDGGAGPPGGPPWQNYASWFLLSFLLTFLLPPNYALRLRRLGSSRPIAILALMNLLFLAAQAASRLMDSRLRR